MYSALQSPRGLAEDLKRSLLLFLSSVYCYGPVELERLHLSRPSFACRIVLFLSRVGLVDRGLFLFL